jgi:hypothetical protein
MPPSARQAQQLSRYLQDIAGVLENWGEHGRPDDTVLGRIDGDLQQTLRSLKRVVEDKENPKQAAGEIAQAFQNIAQLLRAYSEEGGKKA